MACCALENLSKLLQLMGSIGDTTGKLRECRELLDSSCMDA